MKSKVLGVSVLLFFTLLTVACGGGGEENTSATTASNSGTNSEEKEEYELDVVSFLPSNDPFTVDIIPLWMEKIEQGTDGKVKANWIGGPEAIPSEDQFNAVSDGTVDISFTASSWYVNRIPEADSLLLSSFTPEEERENGYYDFMNDRFEEHNISYLGRWMAETPYYFWTNESISDLGDLSGLEFRSNPVYHNIMSSLEISPINIHPTDVYTSLERGVVDGVAYPLIGPVDNSWTEVINYIIDEPFLESQNATILMNKNSLSSLPEDLQNKIKELTAEFEIEMADYFAQLNEDHWEKLQNEGVEVIELNEKDSEKFQQVVLEEKWNELKEAVSEDVYNDIESLLQ